MNQRERQAHRRGWAACCNGKAVETNPYRAAHSRAAWQAGWEQGRRAMHQRERWERVCARTPATWAEYAWPYWVPASVRIEVEDFWSGPGRSPRHWMESADENGAPPLGTRCATWRSGYTDVAGDQGCWVVGRYVHAWNNMARVVLDDGTVAVTALVRGWLTPEEVAVWQTIDGGGKSLSGPEFVALCERHGADSDSDRLIERFVREGWEHCMPDDVYWKLSAEELIARTHAAPVAASR